MYKLQSSTILKQKMLQLIHYTVTNILYTCLDTVVVISFGTKSRNVMVFYFISIKREEYLEKQGKFANSGN
jgi:hypothetical protein